MKEVKKLIVKQLGFLPCKISRGNNCPHRITCKKGSGIVCLYNCVGEITENYKGNTSRALADFFIENTEIFNKDFILPFNGSIALSPYLKDENLDNKNLRQQLFLVEIRNIVEKIIK